MLGAVMRALEQAGHQVVPIGITKQGRWLVSGDPLEALASGRPHGEQVATMLPEPGHTSLVALPESGAPPASITSLDVVCAVLHGTYGEDGTVQGLFELAGVPYVGSGVLGSAVAMDKVMMKAAFAAAGLAMARWL